MTSREAIKPVKAASSIRIKHTFLNFLAKIKYIISSIAYVLHSIMGGGQEKAAAFQNLKNKNSCK